MSAIDGIDRTELLRLLDLLLDAVGVDEPMCRYLEGRIDGHCLQNAIGYEELLTLAHAEGYTIGWETAMQVVAA